MVDSLKEIFIVPFKVLLLIILLTLLAMVFLLHTTITLNQSSKTECARLATGIRDYARDNAGFSGASSYSQSNITLFETELNHLYEKGNFKQPIEIKIETETSGVSFSQRVEPNSYISVNSNLTNKRLQRGNKYTVTVTPYYMKYPWQDGDKYFKGTSISVCGVVSGYIKTEDSK